MSTQVGKMAFNEKSKMSLNDRFQMLRQTAQKRAQTSAANARASALHLRQGSAKNRRLAMQMANRPAVRAALRGNSQNSVKQRLGVKRNAVRAAPRFRITRPNFNRNRNANANANTARQNFNRNRNVNANTNTVPNRGRRIRNFRVNNTFAAQPQRRGFKMNRMRNMKPKPGMRNMRAVNAQQTQTRRFKINRNFNTRNGKNARTQRTQGGRRNFVKKVMPTKQQLDSDLDAYMAGSKSFLDSELDAYMTQTS